VHHGPGSNSLLAAQQGVNMETDKIKILLVDDDASILQLYEKYLSGDVFEKRSADNGKDALAIFHEWHPDAIVLDIMMPVMTGFVVLEVIRTTEKDKTAKIIMSTSLSDKQDIQDCAKLGIQGYIVKPFKPNELANKIMHCIQQD
jgi:DNA-binding response OmpR family regulator